MLAGFVRKDAQRFLAHAEGSVAIALSLALPVLLGVGVMAVELSQANALKIRLQTLADGAALAGARELRLGNANSETVVEVARNHVAGGWGAVQSAYSFAGTVGEDRRKVTISLSADIPAGLSAGFGLLPPRVSANAVARLAGSESVCALALSDSAPGAISLESASALQAKKCGVYANSTNPLAIDARDNSKLEAAEICSAGGKSAGTTNFSPQPQTDCPKVADPLASRAAPSVAGCNALKLNLSILGIATTLSPGTYCGGLKVSAGAIVTLLPGTYVIKDGPLVVDGNAVVAGIGVSFYFTGSGAGMQLKQNSVVSLVAPKLGTMAGMLFFQDRTMPGLASFEIASDDAAILLGTLYFPQGRLKVSGSKPIAQNSAYTIVVAREIKLSAGPTMVLNSDYSKTDVPVPAGIGPMARSINLER